MTLGCVTSSSTRLPTRRWRFASPSNRRSGRCPVCNALETLLCHRGASKTVLPGVLKALHEQGVEIRGCAATLEIFGDAIPAKPSDWSEEFLAPILACRIVDSMDDAIDHIREYGSDHTDIIVTNDYANSQRWLRRVNSSTSWSASTLIEIRRWIPARAGRRDRNLDLEAPRLRTDGTRKFDRRKMDRAG